MRFPTLVIEFTGMEVLQRAESVPPAVMHRSAMLAAQWVQALWINLAQRMDIRGSGAYIRGLQSAGSIRVVSSELRGSTYEVVIEVVATAPQSQLVEEGHGPFHLPDKINWSSATGRVKRTKSGKPYLHIPFRHRAHASAEEAEKQGLTPSTMRAMMPADIYAKAKRLKYTVPLNVGPIYRFDATKHGHTHDAEMTRIAHAANAVPRSQGAYRAPGGGHQYMAGQFVQADRYRWGGRLNRAHTRPQITGGHAAAGISAGGSGWAGGVEEHRGARIVGRDSGGNPMINPAWGSSKYHGLFKSGGRGHSQYMTIRTVTPDSKGWHIPAMIGRYVAQRVANEARTNPDLAAIMLEPLLAALGGAKP